MTDDNETLMYENGREAGYQDGYYAGYETGYSEGYENCRINIELQLLEAKDAVFNLIEEYCVPTRINDYDDKLYFCNYCEFTLERAFNAIEIPNDTIEEFEFYKLWEENNRKLWAVKGNTDEMPEVWTAKGMYKVFGGGHISERSSL